MDTIYDKTAGDFYRLRNLARDGSMDFDFEKQEDRGYALVMTVGDLTATQLTDFYRKNLEEYERDEFVPVYGSSEIAEEALLRKEGWGTAKQGEWAVDVRGVLAKHLERDGVYESVLENISASTLATVSFAEGNLPVGRPEDYGFYREIVRDLRKPVAPVEPVEAPGGEPIEVDLDEESEPAVEEERPVTEEPVAEEPVPDIEEEPPFEEPEPVEEPGPFDEIDEELEEPVEEERLDYDQILEETVTGARSEIKDLEKQGRIEEEDYEELFQREREGQNRVTMLSWLEERKPDDEL